MANLPAKVKIGGMNVTIKYVDRKKIKGDAIFSRIGMNTLIDRELCREQKLAAIIHESLHAMFAERCLGHKFKARDEEYIVKHLEPAIHAWIKDNPTLIKSIMKG